MKKPEIGKQVLVKTKNSLDHINVTTGMYIPKQFREDLYSNTNMDCDYNEEKDIYYWSEGWYEFQQTNLEFTWSFIHDEVISWKEIPKF